MSGKLRLVAWFAILLISLSPCALAQDGGWEAEVGDIVYATALSGDGSRQIVGSRNDRAAAYDSGGNLLWEFNPDGTVWGVGISGDGQWVAVASEDRYLYLLDAEGSPVWSLRSSQTFGDAAVSRDGTYVVAVDEGQNLYIVDRATGDIVLQQRLEDQSDTLTVYESDPIGVIVGTRASRVYRFDIEGQEVWQARFPNDIVDVAASGDGAKVAVGTLDGKVSLLDGAAGAVIWQIDMPDPVSCKSRERRNCIKLDMTADGGQILVGAKNGVAYLLDGEDGSVRQEQTLDGSPVSAVAISGGGEVFLFGTRAGITTASNMATAAATVAAAQQSQLLTALGIAAAAAVVTAAGALWVRRTEAGRRFWDVRAAKARRTLWLMWRKRTSYLLLLPTIILLLIFNYYPAFSGLYHGFTEWKPGIETTWVGLKQFEKMLNSPYFWTGVSNAILLAVTAVLKLSVPLFVAELIFHVRNSRLQYSLRTAFILPLVLPSVVGILLWVNIYDPNIGLLNQTLDVLGLGHLQRAWLGDRDTALAAIITIGFPWVSPFALLVFYGGLISIPGELFDAAKVDGANWRQRFLGIDLPMLMGPIKMLLILAFIGSMQEFQTIFLTTGGGPGNVTYTPALELYYQATRFTNYGLASAMGTALFIVILGATVLNLRYVRSQAEFQPD
ncbi:MAG: PQQ-binding-like beta-propeller repeat protein [Anaerolineae bacterium]|nr:PQQ-binding-like beta-propeller repeat protein [Anaerolineae bacterium]